MTQTSVPNGPRSQGSGCSPWAVSNSATILPAGKLGPVATALEPLPRWIVGGIIYIYKIYDIILYYIIFIYLFISSISSSEKKPFFIAPEDLANMKMQ
jgi:hypothetical protein